MLSNLNRDEKEFFCNELMNNVFGIFSPFELDENVDFPKKDELGGVVLKFIGGGACYFKIQTEMPSENELKSIHEVGKFLKQEFGDYVVIKALCMPDIEIHDIDLEDFEIEADFVSARKSHGDIALEILTKKLKNNEEFTEEDHYLMFFLPFMGHDDYEEFEVRYSELLELFSKSNLELPEVCNLDQFNIGNCFRESLHK